MECMIHVWHIDDKGSIIYKVFLCILYFWRLCFLPMAKKTVLRKINNNLKRDPSPDIIIKCFNQ